MYEHTVSMVQIASAEPDDRTVGQAPHPVVTSIRLKNVPPKGIWGWDNRWTLAYHPSTWYIDED